MGDLKKANAILEYALLLFIVVGFITGINKFVERSIKGRVKTETDSKLKQPIPFLWQGSLAVRSQKAEEARLETTEGEVETVSSSDTGYVSLTAPTPPGVNVAGIHSQDAAGGTGSEPKKRVNPVNTPRYTDEAVY